MTASTRLLARVGTAAVLATIGYALVQQARRWDLRGRTVLVTGGSRGLGLSIARELARVGARVAICGRDEATLDRARCELERDRKSTRLNSSHTVLSRMPSSA